MIYFKLLGIQLLSDAKIKIPQNLLTIELFIIGHYWN